MIINTVVYVKGDFGLGSSEVAWALGAFGAGSLAVAVILPRVFRRVRDRSVMMIGGMVLAASMVLTWLSAGSLATLMLCWVVAGVGTSMVLTSSGRLIQRSGDSEERPSLFAAQFSLSHLAWLVTYPIAGWVGTAAGLTIAWSILGGLAVAGVIVALSAWPRDRVAATPGGTVADGVPHAHDARTKAAVSGVAQAECALAAGQCACVPTV